MTIHRYRTRSSDDSETEFLGQNYNLAYPYCTYNKGSICNFVKGVSSYEWCEDYINPGPPYKEGHEFILKRKTSQHNFSRDVDVSAYFYRYLGKFAINASSNSTVDAALAGYSSTAGTFGAEAIKKMRPVQPRMGLGQALGELRDFPSLFKVSLRRFKDLGSAYLNYQFGWKPFLKDLLDVINYQKKVEKHVAFVRKNNNKWLRRRCTIYDGTIVGVPPSLANTTPALVSYLYNPVGSVPTVTGTLITKDKVWAVARMKYYIRDLSLDKAESVWTSPLLRKITGLEITPSLLWELAPWSWLTDWFCNIGDFYSNLTNNSYDNLVTKYAYVMRTRSTSVVYTAIVKTRMNPPVCSNGRITGWIPAYGGPQPSCSAAFTAECKERAGAAWWGIGGNAGPALTDHQLSILAALGLQRI